MSIEANWQRGRTYFWVHKSSLACCFLGGNKAVANHLKMPVLGLRLEKPPCNADDYHRCEITVVRTKAEARALDRKRAALRAKANP